MKVLEQKLENQKEELKKQNNSCYNFIIEFYIPVLKKDIDKIVKRFSLSQLIIIYQLSLYTKEVILLKNYIHLLVA